MNLYNSKTKATNFTRLTNINKQFKSTARVWLCSTPSNFMEPHKHNARKWPKWVPVCSTILECAFSTVIHGNRLKFISMKLSWLTLIISKHCTEGPSLDIICKNMKRPWMISSRLSIRTGGMRKFMSLIKKSCLSTTRSSKDKRKAWNR